jgi:hypothetical protein
MGICVFRVECRRNLIDCQAPFAQYLHAVDDFSLAGASSKCLNWVVFKQYFERTENLTESFQRLYPSRKDTMHGRLISQDDALYTYAERKRILTTIRKRKSK